MNSAPIGIFDSGVGGLTVARSIIDQLPNEELLYIGDTAHTPYGDKPLATVRQLSLDVMDELVDHGVKMLVIACNTATAAVLADARERYDVPVIEVIKPAVRRAVATTRNNKVGVIGTRATVKSRAYEDAFAAAVDVEVTSAACPRFVQFVESGTTTGPEVIAAAEEYLAPIKAAGVDTVVLGCTHYPHLAGAVSVVMGPEVTLVSSSEETALEVYRELRAGDLLREDAKPPLHTFAETAPRVGRTSQFAQLSQRFLGPAISRTATIPMIDSKEGLDQ
ncbi:glutamate racemase [Helcobacillus massiliensis]|uniref:Glutamate racemase n=1 Tax=Helcobacillus massiliensis TaxID=521392 RepID=A0A839QP18_9MICO|nr:glutamate racemase [Helcobacillus massiliensis]MBB3022054.1 glutamate racemase [Helcobacillus massiliensis]MDK7742295.1 glutamate racemase [Helcobacillus massiliensis]WOO93545.1 glutamate racemase [Helcobacillus massiliensis]